MRLGTFELALASRAETIRHVEALAEKKKRRGSGVYWEVKASAQQDLGIELEAYKDEETGEPCPANTGEGDPPSAKKRKLDNGDCKEGGE